MNKSELNLFNYYVPESYYEGNPANQDWAVNKDYIFKPYSPVNDFKLYRQQHPGSFKSQLCGYLNDKTTVEFKIKWLLDHKHISDQRLADSINKKINDNTIVSQQQINYFRRGKRDIRNMTLKLAESLALAYIGIINKNLL